MSDIDEILGNSSNNSNYKYNNNRNNNQKNNWKDEQNKIRQEIYDTMERMAVIVGNDGEKFKEYLNIQSAFVKYSVGNSLVILEKQPNATQIKDKASWNEKGIELNSGAKGINILEPKVSNNITYYNPKTVYDISETNSKEIKQTINYGDRLLLEALLHNCTVPRKAVEQLPNGTIGSEYDKDNNILYVCKNMDRETLFQTLSQEMGNIELLNEEDSNMKNFISYCTSYMICKKYGIDVSNFNFDNLPQEISSQEDGKGIRKELEKIRSTFEKVNSRMLDYFDMKNKDKNKSIPER